MQLPDAVRRVILAVLPWYHEREVEARHSATSDAVDESVRQRARMRSVIDSYRKAGERLSRL